MVLYHFNKYPLGLVSTYLCTYHRAEELRIALPNYVVSHGVRITYGCIFLVLAFGESRTSMWRLQVGGLRQCGSRSLARKWPLLGERGCVLLPLWMACIAFGLGARQLRYQMAERLMFSFLRSLQPLFTKLENLTYLWNFS